MENKLTIPNVEIVENGKPISQERMDPAVVQFIMQAAATAQLVKLRKLEESKIPTGASTYEWTITTTPMEIKLDRPWISFALINDGSGDIKMRINTQEGDISRETTVKNGGSIDWDFDFPIITKLFLVAVSGTATVRVYAEEGKWA